MPHCTSQRVSNGGMDAATQCEASVCHAPQTTRGARGAASCGPRGATTQRDTRSERQA